MTLQQVVNARTSRVRSTEIPGAANLSASGVRRGVKAGVGANESVDGQRQRATNARLGGAGLRLPVSLLLAAARGAPGRRHQHCILRTTVRVGSALKKNTFNTKLSFVYNF